MRTAAGAILLPGFHPIQSCVCRVIAGMVGESGDRVTQTGPEVAQRSIKDYQKVWASYFVVMSH